MNSPIVFFVSLTLCLVFVRAQFATCPLVASKPCGTTGSCLNFTVDTTGTTYCACRSGYGGLDCQFTVDPALNCVFNNVSSMVTNYPPINVTASFNNDVFTVSVYSPLVAQRIYTKIAVDSHGIEDYNCTYPGNFWTHTVEGCTDRYVGNMPWINTLHCGWIFDGESDPFYFQYNATMIIDQFDTLDTFAGRGPLITRETLHVVPLLVLFQRYIDVSSSVAVQSPVRMFVAVVRQEIDPLTRNAVVEIATNLLFPYLINSSSLNPPNSSRMEFQLSEMYDPASGLCPNTPGSTCIQVFRISITTNGACTITGSYGVTFGLSCQIGSDCNLPPHAQALAVAQIVSEDFCAKISAKVEISGTLASFSSSSYSSHRSNFVVDTISFFKATVTSTQAALTKSSLRSVSLVNSNNSAETFLIFSEGKQNPIFSDSVKFSVDISGPDFVEFFFTLNSTIFNNVSNLDFTKNFNVVARVEVEFAGVPGIKRVDLDSSLNSRQVSLGTKFQVSDHRNSIFGIPTENYSDCSNLIFGLANLFIVLVGSLLM